MTTTELATVTAETALAVLTSPEKFDELIGKIRAEVASHVPDLTTKKGRDAIKSLAYKVTRTKTALDDAGKELNAGKRAEINAVDEVRRKVREDLDALAADARKPLDEWEAKEAERQAAITLTMKVIQNSTEFPDSYTSGEIQTRITALNALEFDADIFQESLEIAIGAKSSVLESLNASLLRVTQAEADAAELAELRRKDAERVENDRIAAEQAAQIEADRIAEESRKAEAAAAEAQRLADAESAETKRLADIKAAEDRAAANAKAEADRVAKEAIDKANAEAEALRQAEANRKAEEDRIYKETVVREADKAHRGAVMKATKEAMMSSGDIDENAAKKIVLAIVAGEVPNVKLAF